MELYVTGKLSKIVAQSENLFADTLFETEHLLRLDTSGSSGGESNQNLGQGLPAKKPCWQTKDNVADCNCKLYKLV